tara:strand:- start:391 stop:582 length:192 start_codon:yes stop_codon:yes gene_type:complete
MASKDEIINEISTVVESLSLKIEALQAKVNELCKSTGECATIEKSHESVSPRSSKIKKKVHKL